MCVGNLNINSCSGSLGGFNPNFAIQQIDYTFKTNKQACGRFKDMEDLKHLP